MHPTEQSKVVVYLLASRIYRLLGHLRHAFYLVDVQNSRGGDAYVRGDNRNLSNQLTLSGSTWWLCRLPRCCAKSPVCFCLLFVASCDTAVDKLTVALNVSRMLKIGGLIMTFSWQTTATHLVLSSGHAENLPALVNIPIVSTFPSICCHSQLERALRCPLRKCPDDLISHMNSATVAASPKRSP